MKIFDFGCKLITPNISDLLLILLPLTRQLEESDFHRVHGRGHPLGHKWPHKTGRERF